MDKCKHVGNLSGKNEELSLGAEVQRLGLVVLVRLIGINRLRLPNSLGNLGLTTGKVDY